MADQTTWTVDTFEKYLKEFENILHPTNMCMIRIKNSLAGFYGRCPGYLVPNLMENRKLLERKEKLTLEVLDILEKIEPGLSASKGN